VTEHITEPLLSIEWLHDNNARWDFHLGSLNLRGWSFRLKVVATENRCRKVITLERINEDTSDTQINHDTDTMIFNKSRDNTNTQNDQNDVSKLVQNDHVIKDNDASVRPKRNAPVPMRFRSVNCVNVKLCYVDIFSDHLMAGLPPVVDPVAYECPVCGNHLFLTARAFRRHICREHGLGCDNLYENVLCGPVNGRFRAANAHERDKHKYKAPLIPDIAKPPVVCPVCGRRHRFHADGTRVLDVLDDETTDEESLSLPQPLRLIEAESWPEITSEQKRRVIKRVTFTELILPTLNERLRLPAKTLFY